MTIRDINDIIKAVCSNDEDYEKPCISPKYLRQELEQLALEQEQRMLEPTTKNDLSSGTRKNSEKLENVSPIIDWNNCHTSEQLDSISTTKNDLALIHTWGLDEGIRCAMCTNSMKSDRGCDGGCVVNNAMYKEVMDVIENHIVDTDKMIGSATKNDLGVDAISRADARSLICNIDIKHQTFGMSRKAFKDLYNGMDELPSVTPIRPKGHWIGNYQVDFGEWQEYDVKLSDGFVTDNCHCSECGEELLSGDRGMFCPNCGADMREVEE